MNDPSLEWMIDKDNPPEDNLSDVKMTSPSDPNTVRFVSPPETDQPLHSTTHSENDDMLTKTAIMKEISLMMSDYDDPPNDKDNSPNVKMFSSSDPTTRFVSTPATDKPSINPPINSKTRTKNDDKLLTKMARALAVWGYNNDNLPDDDVTMSIQTEKVVESPLSSPVTSLHSFTTHSKSTDNTENNPNITSPPPPPPSPPTPSTTSVRKIREKRRKRNKRKARDQHTKHLEQQVAELKQQLNEKQKQKEKEKITSELFESLERSK